MTWQRTATPPRPSSMASSWCAAKVSCGLSKTDESSKNQAPITRDSNTKHQTPKKSQSPNPNSARDVAPLELGIWSFHPGVWILVFESLVRCFDSPVVQRVKSKRPCKNGVN